jgi:hypothetical protein
VPSKEDYSNFALYQANQKAYESTFLKNFVAHALHPDQIDACFQDGVDTRANLHRYMREVSSQVSSIARKMAWNAHYRVIHLLANDGKDGAPFLDVHTINPKVASDFGPDKVYEVVCKMNGSWHRAFPEPVMVRFSTQEYRVDYHHSMPLEEIDEVADTLFNKNAFAKSLPTGRAFRPPASKKCRGQYAPGAAVREAPTVTPRGNWLTFTSLDTPFQLYSPLPGASTSHDAIDDAETHDAHQEPLLPEDLRNLQHDEALASPPTGPSQCHIRTSHSPITKVEEPDAPDNDYRHSPIRSGSIELEKVLSWRARLSTDHKRRLTRKWGNPPQVLEKVLPGIKQALAAAYARDIRPIAPDYQKTVNLIVAREQQQHADLDRPQEEDFPVIAKTFYPTRKRTSNDHFTSATMNLFEVIPGKGQTVAPSPSSSSSLAEHTTIPRKSKGKGRPIEVAATMSDAPFQPPKKRRRTDTPMPKRTMNEGPTKQKIIVKSPKQANSPASPRSPTSLQPLPPHPSGSKALEPHQQLPPGAYFQPTSIDEKPVWRCGVKHAMGHYYNAGDRKSCRGCNTSLSDNTYIVEMDFYMPPRSFHHQPAPGMKWRPNKSSAGQRKSGNPCHNGVAKDAYWAAINAGATEDESRQMGVNAVVEFLKPKPPPKAPTPEPTPEPEPDLGPHPSGFTTMEHGQELPECAYGKKQDRHEEFAWRCDVNHALGRYYLAGDKKSCPGCGSNKGGLGKHAVMDFFMPPGVMVRQEAPHLVNWKPRKYKARASKSTKAKTAAQTHNQICAEKYFQAIYKGLEDEEALRFAVEATDAQLDEKQEEVFRKHEEQDEDGDDDESIDVAEAASHSKNDSGTASQAGSSKSDDCRRNSRGGYTGQLGHRKQNMNDLEDDEMDEVEVYQTSGNSDAAPSSPEVIDISSGEEETSGSDSQ